MAKKHCLVPLLSSQRIRSTPPSSHRPHGSTLGRAMVHLLFPRHRVDAPHETRVRLATVLLHFCLPILRNSLFPRLFSRCLVPFVSIRARLCRVKHALVSRSPREKKRKSPEGASSRPGSRAFERAAMEIKVLSLFLSIQILYFTLLHQEIILKNATTFYVLL